MMGLMTLFKMASTSCQSLFVVDMDNIVLTSQEERNIKPARRFMDMSHLKRHKREPLK